MAEPQRVAWLTKAPDALQVRLLEAIADRPDIDLEVVCCARVSQGRVWAWDDRPGGFACRFLPGFRVGRYHVNPAAIRHFVRHRYDVVVVTNYAQPTMVLAMIVLSLLRRPWILATEPPSPEPGRLVRLTRPLLLALPRRFARGGIGTGVVAQRFLEDQFGDDRPVRSVPYSVDLSAFYALPREGDEPAPVRFLFSGQLIRRKGIDTLVTAVEGLLDDGLDFRLDVAGIGPEGARLEALAERHRDRITMFGFLGFEERVAAYRRADVLVLPSRNDGWGVVVHEAMAAGMPVIGTTATGAVVDLVVDGVHGWVIPPSDPGALAAAMRRVIDDPASIARMGSAARERARIHTIEGGAAKVAQVVTQAAS